MAHGSARRNAQLGVSRVSSYNLKALLNATVNSMTQDRSQRSDPWGDGDDSQLPQDRSFKSLTRDEALALRRKTPLLNPWRVILTQVGVGLVVALMAWGVFGKTEFGWSALYGAAVVVVPGALMARGMTSRLTGMSPGVSAVSFMLWEFVKIGVAVALLVLAPRLVQPLSWPALLVAMVLCMKVYWVALLWRGKTTNQA